MEHFTTTDVIVEGMGGTSTAVTVTVSYDFDLYFGGVVGLNTIYLEKVAAMPDMSRVGK
jgi:hypothetical protein